jgi:NADPH:quinone reductase-like Zn-dependent oxidoreductase
MSTIIPTTMKAWVYSSRGSPRAVLRLSSRPAPSAPTGTQVLIKVHYSALNLIGTLLMKLIPSVFVSTWGAPELDFSGEIVAAGPDAPTALTEPGTPVWGTKLIPSVLKDHAGTLAEYVKVDSSTVAPLPKVLSAEEASGLAVVGSTAIQMLDQAGVTSGDRILVNGASGGVGTILVQLGKAMGLDITAICSGSNVDAVKELGANEVLDYRKAEPDLPRYLAARVTSNPFDAILDCVGAQDMYKASPSFLKARGKYINVGSMGGLSKVFYQRVNNELRPTWLGGTPRKWMFMAAEPSSKTMDQLRQHAEEGNLKCLVDSTYKMEDALEVCELLRRINNAAFVFSIDGVSNGYCNLLWNLFSFIDADDRSRHMTSYSHIVHGARS